MLTVGFALAVTTHSPSSALAVDSMRKRSPFFSVDTVPSATRLTIAVAVMFGGTCYVSGVLTMAAMAWREER